MPPTSKEGATLPLPVPTLPPRLRLMQRRLPNPLTPLLLPAPLLAPLRVRVTKVDNYWLAFSSITK